MFCQVIMVNSNCVLSVMTDMSVQTHDKTDVKPGIKNNSPNHLYWLQLFILLLIQQKTKGILINTYLANMMIQTDCLHRTAIDFK